MGAGVEAKFVDCATRSACAGSFETIAITSMIGWAGVQEYPMQCITTHFNVGGVTRLQHGEDGAA